MFEIPTTESGPHGRYRDHVLLRCYLRFLWWKDSHLDEEMVEVKMCAHVLGVLHQLLVAFMPSRKHHQIIKKNVVKEHAVY